MKYIKIFENIESDTYEEIDRLLYNRGISNSIEYDIRNGKITYYTSNEDKILTELGFKDNRREGELIKKLYLFQKPKNYIDHSKSTYDHDITITKCNDDWFYIKSVLEYDTVSLANDETKYFKCDQLEGLLKCLSYKFNIERRHTKLFEDIKYGYEERSSRK